MKKIEDIAMTLMWIVVALTIVIFFAVIMIGHATSYDFFFGLQDSPEVTTSLVKAFL
ncbi:MAG TPA: hypothetical protein VK067_02125 [Pseudogracilibacillus sp.]|nr:hypothetical protein [Pseudogracilibacillus sp.]